MTYYKGQVHQHGYQYDQYSNGGCRRAESKKERYYKGAGYEGYHGNYPPIQFLGDAPYTSLYLLQRLVHRKLVGLWLSLPNRHQVLKFFHSGCIIQLIFV